MGNRSSSQEPLLGQEPCMQPAAQRLTCTSLADFSMAMRTLFTRLGWPLPMPSRRLSLAMVMALLFTCFTHLHLYTHTTECDSH